MNHGATPRHGARRAARARRTRGRLLRTGRSDGLHRRRAAVPHGDRVQPRRHALGDELARGDPRRAAPPPTWRRRPATSPTASSRNCSATAPPILHLVRVAVSEFEPSTGATASPTTASRSPDGACSCPAAAPGATASPPTLRAQARRPIVAPMINFAPTDDAAGPRGRPRQARRRRIRLAHRHERHDRRRALLVPAPSIRRATKIAAVGETTAAALIAAGYQVDIVPSEDNSARGLLEEWEAATERRQALRVLALRSAIAKPLLLDRPRPRRATTSRRSSPTARSACPSRRRSSPTSRRAGQRRARDLGQRRRAGAGAARSRSPRSRSSPASARRPRRMPAQIGLRVDVVARERTAESLIDAVVEAATAHA